MRRQGRPGGSCPFLSDFAYAPTHHRQARRRQRWKPEGSRPKGSMRSTTAPPGQRPGDVQALVQLPAATAVYGQYLAGHICGIDGEVDHGAGQLLE